MVDAPREKLTRLVENLHQVAEDDHYELDSSFNAKVKDYYRVDSETYRGFSGSIKRFFHRLAEAFHKGIFGSRDIVKVAARIDRFLAKEEVQSLLSQGSPEHLSQEDVNRLERDIIRLRNRLRNASESNTYTRKVRNKTARVASNLNVTLISSTLSTNSTNESLDLINREHLEVPPPVVDEHEDAQAAANEDTLSAEEIERREREAHVQQKRELFGEPAERRIKTDTQYIASSEALYKSIQLFIELNCDDEHSPGEFFPDGMETIYIHRGFAGSPAYVHDKHFTFEVYEQGRGFLYIRNFIRFFEENGIDIKAIFNDFKARVEIADRNLAETYSRNEEYPLESLETFLTYASSDAFLTNKFREFLDLHVRLDTAEFRLKAIEPEVAHAKAQQTRIIEERDTQIAALMAEKSQLEAEVNSLPTKQKELETALEEQFKIAKALDEPAKKESLLSKVFSSKAEKAPLVATQEKLDQLSDTVSRINAEINKIETVTRSRLNFLLGKNGIQKTSAEFREQAIQRQDHLQHIIHERNELNRTVQEFQHQIAVFRPL